MRFCLHKFCYNCIEKYNRTVKKVCPSCRQSISSKRVLRSDFKVDKILKMLITDIKAFNKMEHELRDRHIKEHYDYEEMQRKMHDGMMNQYKAVILQQNKE